MPQSHVAKSDLLSGAAVRRWHKTSVAERRQFVWSRAHRGIMLEPHGAMLPVAKCDSPVGLLRPRAARHGR